jgi:hypothetical protein
VRPAARSSGRLLGGGAYRRTNRRSTARSCPSVAGAITSRRLLSAAGQVSPSGRGSPSKRATTASISASDPATTVATRAPASRRASAQASTGVRGEHAVSQPPQADPQPPPSATLSRMTSYIAVRAPNTAR